MVFALYMGSVARRAEKNSNSYFIALVTGTIVAPCLLMFVLSDSKTFEGKVIKKDFCKLFRCDELKFQWPMRRIKVDKAPKTDKV